MLGEYASGLIESIDRRIFTRLILPYNMNRRQLLGFSAGIGISSAAGCISPDESSYATMQKLTLANLLNNPVTAEVKIKRDDIEEVVYLEDYEIPTDPGTVTLDCVWPDAPVTVLVRPVDADEWSDLTTSDEEGCLGVIAGVREQKASYYVHNASECPIRNPDCHIDVAE
jgi:hypothetical protein